jgi:hypothetical protein
VAVRDGDRFIYHGPRGEELIVSGTLLEGQGDAATVADAQTRLLQNAMDSASSAASHPDLVTVKPLLEDREAVAAPLRAWTVVSETKPRDALFAQAIVSNGMDVLLITFESPYDPERFETFRRFLKGVRPATTH